GTARFAVLGPRQGNQPKTGHWHLKPSSRRRDRCLWRRAYANDPRIDSFEIAESPLYQSGRRNDRRGLLIRRSGILPLFLRSAARRRAYFPGSAACKPAAGKLILWVRAARQRSAP